MLTLIENGQIFAPQPQGQNSILCAGDKILKIGSIDARAIEKLNVSLEVIDADDCFVVPGLIDPHEHLLGGSGESGFASQTPEIQPSEIVLAGITTVIGCLGVDTTMKTLPGLLAKAKGLKEEGISAYVWTGGYNVPPTTITDSIRNDILFIEEIIGAGEIAISDNRSTDPLPHELARLVDDSYVGGMLASKAGVTHFHVGENSTGLQLLRTLIEEFKTPPETIYPTHVERNEKLMLEAIELTRIGCFIDVDTVEQDLPKWFKFYLDNDGDPNKLTISSDASISSPQNVIAGIRACVLEHKIPLEQVLRLATANTAKVLKLEQKGVLAENKAADMLVLQKETLEIKEAIVGGRRVIKHGKLAFREKFLADSNRHFSVDGGKSEKHS